MVTVANNPSREKNYKRFVPVIILAVVVFGFYMLFVYLGVFPLSVQFRPVHPADAKGLIDRWEKEGEKASVVIEQRDGTFKKIVLQFDNETQVLRAKQDGGEERKYRRGKLDEVDDGVFVEIYAKRISPRSREKVVETLIYWE